MEHKGMKIMAKNRQVYHDYFVEEEYEAGIELFGTEVKSIRAGTLNLKDAWCGHQRWGALRQPNAYFSL